MATSTDRVDDPMWGNTYEADFDANTWTFRMVGNDWEVSKGPYALLHNDDYDSLNWRLSNANQDKEAMSSRIFDLELAILKICQANDAFSRDTGLKVNDMLSDAIEWGRSKIALPLDKNGDPSPL